MKDALRLVGSILLCVGGMILLQHSLQDNLLIQGAMTFFGMLGICNGYNLWINTGKHIAEEAKQNG